MIEKLPLDLFDERPEDETPPADSTPVAGTTEQESHGSPATCRWCGAHLPDGAVVCLQCDARSIPVDAPAADLAPAEPSLPGVCQWCTATIGPDDEICPECGGNTRADTSQQIPGLTVPLPESSIRSQVTREMREDETGSGYDADDLVTDIITHVIKHWP